MTVYILIIYRNEDDYICGVFDSYEKAKDKSSELGINGRIVGVKMNTGYAIGV